MLHECSCSPHTTIVVGLAQIKRSRDWTSEFDSQIGVQKYRSTYGERFERSRFYKALTASKVYNVYRWFQPE